MPILSEEDYLTVLAELISINTVSPLTKVSYKNTARFLSGFGFRPQENFFIKGDVNSKHWIYSHIDTKPPLPLEDWCSNPFKMEEADDKIYGLGISDAKFQLLNVLNISDDVKDSCIIIDTEEENDGLTCARYMAQFHIDTLFIVDGTSVPGSSAFNGLMGQYDGKLTLQTNKTSVHPSRKKNSDILALLDQFIWEQKKSNIRLQVTGISAPVTIRSLTTETVDIRFDIRYDREQEPKVKAFISKYNAVIRQHMPPVRGNEVLTHPIISSNSLPFSCNLGREQLNSRRILVVPGAEAVNGNHKPNEFIYRCQILQHAHALQQVLGILDLFRS